MTTGRAGACDHVNGHISTCVRAARAWSSWFVVLLLSASCSSPGSAGSGSAASGGYPAFAGGAGVPAGLVGAGGAAGLAPPVATGGVPSGGAPPFGAGGAIVGGAGTGIGGVSAAAGGAPSAGAGGQVVRPPDHCMDGEPADPSDAMLTSLPDEWKATNGDIDLVLPKPVLGWMGARLWEVSHDAWHNVRRCKGGGAPPTSTAICAHKELIPPDQECSDAEDGYEFLVTHRHMIMTLRAAFPQHADLFQGFPHFPFDATDVPVQWQSRWGTGWSAQIQATARTLEAIESNLSQFPTEGDLGKYIQCGGMASGASSIHGALHFKWVVNSSPYSLGKQTVNIDNYMFWKLHGWIDEIWERYRVAKGLTPDEPKLMEAMLVQCREMQALGNAVDPSARAAAANTPLPVEHGVFHETVRPILERVCSGCHSESSPEANMSLGGHISSADVVKGLVNVQSAHGGQFLRIVPGDPDHSWLYLKISGMAATAGCTGTACNNEVMPPTGQVTLSAADLSTVRQWIQSGAPPPTQ